MSGRHRPWPGIVCGLSVFVATGAILAASSGPQPGVSGVPAGGGMLAEMTCRSCHATSPMNPDLQGSLRIEGLPGRYAPGARYALVFRVEHPAADRLRWGFQLTAVDAETFRGAGRFVASDPRTTQVVDGHLGARQYVEHTYWSTGVGERGGMAWSFDWVAPEAGGADVAFFASANAADANGAKEGDWIFSPSPDPLALVRAPEPSAGE